MDITEFLVVYITKMIAWGGYTMVALLMALESMIAPVPSEAVMPFVGFLIVEQQFTFAGAIFFSTLGSIIGSLLSYYIGLYGGEPFVRRFGRYLLLDLHHLEITERFFARHGEKAIFISRFVPVVRHLISIPAGTGKMNIVKFSVYTVLGAGLWNAFLAYVGFVLKENWAQVRKYLSAADVLVIIALVGAVAYFIYRRFRNSRMQEG